MKTVLSPPAPGWRMLPPGGAPLGLGAIARALLDSRKGRRMADRFGQALFGRFGAGHVLLSSSGSAALALALTALRQLRPDRDQILLLAYVSYSVPSAVARAGCHISLYDVDPVTLGPRLDSLEAAVSEKTLAVVACHQFGLAFDLEPIRSVCAGAGAFLVDDAAQAMGASVGGVPAGTMGDVGLFSLSRGKPITAVEGGILLCNDDRIADGLRAVQKQLPEPGFSPRAALKAVALAVLRHPAIYRIPASLPWLGIGASVFDPDFEQAGLSAFQAGLGLSSLLELYRINRQRHRKA